MNKTILILFQVLVEFNAFAQLPPNDPNYQLVFEDNFDSTSINTSKWNSSWPWGQSGYFEPWVCQQVKNQGQSYKRTNFENCTVDSGTLKIISKKERYYGICNNYPSCSDNSCTGKPCYPGNFCANEYSLWFNYTTNLLVSKETFKYGYFEIKCRLPKPVAPKTNKGIGPNFWLYGANSTVGWSEIDIFEFNGETGQFGSNVHYEDKYGNITHGITDGTAIIDNVDFSTFHIFSALWTPNKIDFFLDRTRYLTTYLHAEELINMSIIIDVNFPLHTICQLIDPTNTQLPHNYEVDYVRVYQLKTDYNTNFNMCNYEAVGTTHYKSINLGGNGCNVTIPSGQSLNLVSSDGLTILSNFTIQSGAQFNYQPSTSFYSIHTFPSSLKSSSNGPAPASFYERQKSKYHEY